MERGDNPESSSGVCDLGSLNFLPFLHTDLPVDHKAGAEREDILGSCIPEFLRSHIRFPYDVNRAVFIKDEILLLLVFGRD